ncbi:acyl-CoA dehydrogenase family protein [Streptomyces sp. NBC_01435]|uniref:acyl-CoA dehydrogenase family protein n=1 Tax=Streptomyces sp. NBC_01435 TaxID=2903865 RepID=UPI002E3250CD|nr:acyl-CoA dehydrogenase family protein [Streptomyces sp. NBC_01435]
MRFFPDAEQREFARSLDALLTSCDTPAVIRSWATGEHGPGRAVGARLAEAGVFALAVPREHDGFGPLPLELAIAFEVLGRHAVPGPLVETVAAAALLDRLGDDRIAAERLPGIASGKSVVSLCLTSLGPYALDGDAADAVFVVDGDTLSVSTGPGEVQPSADPARRLSRPTAGTVLARGESVAAAAGYAADVAALATAAQALGVGRTLLARTVGYVTQRTQFGVAIGSFQAIKHRLADTLLALEFAEPLVHGAALALAAGDDGAGREIAAAKVTAGEAAYGAARTALQLHGAVGYTDELDLSLWIRKARPLRDAWGTPAACRARVLAA